jgi:hypothetical protein
MERIIGPGATFARRKVNDPEVRTHLAKGKGPGYFKRASAWIRYAHKNDYDGLAFVIDQDGQAEREAELTQAQELQTFALPRAMGVAIRTFDAWMLADEKALSTALRCTVNRQKDPESNNDPKSSCEILMLDGKCTVSQTELYCEILKHVDLILLEQRCRRGFAPFAERARAMVRGIGAMEGR